jgi:hypothetical protein
LKTAPLQWPVLLSRSFILQATLKRALKYLYSGSSDVLAPVSLSADAAADSGDLSSITLLQQVSKL